MFRKHQVSPVFVTPFAPVTCRKADGGPISVLPCPPIGLLHSMAVTKRMKGVPAAWQHQSNGRAGRYYLSVSLRASSPAVLAHPDSAEASEARPSRRQDCHSAAPPSPFSRCFNMDEKGVSALNDNLANG